MLQCSSGTTLTITTVLLHAHHPTSFHGISVLHGVVLSQRSPSPLPLLHTQCRKRQKILIQSPMFRGHRFIQRCSCAISTRILQKPHESAHRSSLCWHPDHACSLRSSFSARAELVMALWRPWDAHLVRLFLPKGVCGSLPTHCTSVSSLAQGCESNHPICPFT